jgi:hypothetical protein
MQQAIGATRPGDYVSYVGVPHGVQLNGQKLFGTHVHLHGGPAPVRRYLPHLIELIETRTIDPARSSISRCRSSRSQRVTVRWASAAQSRRCCACDLADAGARDRRRSTVGSFDDELTEASYACDAWIAAVGGCVTFFVDVRTAVWIAIASPGA